VVPGPEAKPAVNEAIVLLGLVWAALLVPHALRSRSASPHTTVGGFERAMDVLRSDSGSGLGRQVLVPADAGRIVGRADAAAVRPLRPLGRGGRRESALIDRRRAWFVRSLAATGGTLLLALVFGGRLWLLFVLAAAPTAAFVAVLRRWKLQRDQAHQVVHDLDRDGPFAGRSSHDEVSVVLGDLAVGSGTVRLRRWDG